MSTAGARLAVATLGISLLLTACDNGPSAVAGKQADGAQTAGAQAGAAPSTDRAAAGAVDHRDDPVKLVDGKPMWSASRRYSAEESARRSFERNGEAFGARTLDQFVRQAHAFVEHPPAGTETLTRPNGDTLFYDPKGNVFAVATKDGAPRTMFKPDEGAAYWAQQKQTEGRRQAARAERQSRSADDAA